MSEFQKRECASRRPSDMLLHGKRLTQKHEQCPSKWRLTVVDRRSKVDKPSSELLGLTHFPS